MPAYGTHEYHQAIGRRGGLTLAMRTDMRKVAARARRSSPSSLDYWRAKITEQFGILDASDRDARARAAQRKYFSDLGKKSAAARRRSA